MSYKTECDCVIEQLINRPFLSRSIADKCEIIKNGRPTPKLHNLTQLNKRPAGSFFVRHFVPAVYDSKEWLAGCDALNKLFCWPCLLFSESHSSTWTTSGFCDLNNFSNAMVRHERSVQHISSYLDFKLFVQRNVNLPLDVNAIQHNNLVKKKRKLLKQLIKATAYLACQEHPKSQYTELLTLVAEYDATIAQHMESVEFAGLSGDIQERLVECIESVLLMEIRTEIEEAKFVSIKLIETSDLADTSMVSTVIRYVSKCGQIKERFLGFSDFNKDRTPIALLNHVRTILESLNCSNKLVAQSYDGAVISSCNLARAQELGKQLFPDSTFVHSLDLDLNMVLTQSLTSIRECKIFFSTLNGLSSYFLQSPKRVQLFSTIVKLRLPNVAPMKWDFTENVVQKALKFHSEFTNTFNSILENATGWDADAVVPCRGFIAFFEDFTSRFLLVVISEIFKITKHLFDFLQKKQFSVDLCGGEILTSIGKLERLQNDFSTLYERTVEMMGSPDPPRKKQAQNEDPRASFQRLYDDIFESIMNQLNCRFVKNDTLKFFELLDCAKFQKYEQSFPAFPLDNLKVVYGIHFDIVALQSELSVIFSKVGFNASISEILNHIISANLLLPQLHNLCLLLLTIQTIVDLEPTSAKLKCIHTCARNSRQDKRLAALAFIIIEKEFLNSMMQKFKSDFYNNVINEFAKKLG